MRKGSMQLSINAIVIVVLAMTFLGLILGFITSQTNEIDNMSGEVLSSISDKILDDLRESDDKMSLPSSEIEITKGKNKLIAFGVKNLLDDTLTYAIEVEDLNDNIDTEDGPVECELELSPSTKISKDTPYCAAFFWDKSNAFLDSDESEVKSVKIFVPNRRGSFMYKIKIMQVFDDDTLETYATKTIFVETK
jgi:hypothetical protein